MKHGKVITGGGVTSPLGFKAGAVYVGIKSHKSYKPDVAVLLSDTPAACAALFTTNRFPAAPVVLGREIVKKGYIRGLLINSGNANAGTGSTGLLAARQVTAFAEETLGLNAGEILVSSTGVIGEALPVEKMKKAVKEITPRLSREAGSEAAWAIMTTDKHRKEAAYELALSGGTVRVGVMAKGSGMIHPNMATVLCFITTDAVMEPDFMRAMLGEACEESFHALTVDGDTSTNDSLIMLASGASGVALENEEDRVHMRTLIGHILGDMAKRIAADGEGAEKRITVRVKGLKDKEDARRIARGVAASNSVKAALGHGRLSEALILSAAGAVESEADFDKVECYLDREGEEVLAYLDFHAGDCEAQAFGCDLTGEYIRLNGDYRT